MEASPGPLSLPTSSPPQPNLENVKRKLLQNGIQPTPKILHNLRKKDLQKANRRLAKEASKWTPPLTPSQKQEVVEESYFQEIKSEYKSFMKNGERKMVGRPWERLERLKLRELASESREYDGDKLKAEHLEELSGILESDKDRFSWLLDNDIEFQEGWFAEDEKMLLPPKRRYSETETIKFLIDRLSETELTVKDWKFTRMMKQSGLQFTEAQMLKIVEGLGGKGQWQHAMSVVEWVYTSRELRRYKSRFVYTKLLTVLGKLRRPLEALRVFNLMRADAHIYPDMAAYHCVAVALGQAGLLKDLFSTIECMKEKPRKIANMQRKTWDPRLQPDIVVFNAVLNACIPTRQWKGVSWVFQQLRKNGLKPNSATYGLAMEVMLQSGKYDLVHEFFGKMKRSGEALKSLTYKVLVKAYWKEGKVDEAVQSVRDMEKKGIVGTASVYYELARCLCYYGRWQEAILEIERLRKLRHARPLAVTFTGMILSSMDGGHVDGCESIFEHSKSFVACDIGIINAMLKVYGRNDMFLKAKELFEEIKEYGVAPENSMNGCGSSPRPDAYTFSSVLEASASALQWEYFEYAYKEMALSGFRLNHSKHAKLLVEASKAGKWHILEHAFETSLEAGEVPELPVFTEMVCQAIALHDYVKATRIINAMAHTPFQVSKQEWIDLFQMNGDRISQTSLKELLDTLCNQELVKEATVLNLSRALRICGSCGSGSLSNLVDHGETLVTLPSNNSDKNDQEKEETDVELTGNHLASRFRAFCIDDEKCIQNRDYDSSDDECDYIAHIASGENDDSGESGIPSAYEILETWKEMR